MKNLLLRIWLYIGAICFSVFYLNSALAAPIESHMVKCKKTDGIPGYEEQATVSVLVDGTGLNIETTYTQTTLVTSLLPVGTGRWGAPETTYEVRNTGILLNDNDDTLAVFNGEVLLPYSFGNINIISRMLLRVYSYVYGSTNFMNWAQAQLPTDARYFILPHYIGDLIQGSSRPNSPIYQLRSIAILADGSFEVSFHRVNSGINSVPIPSRVSSDIVMRFNTNGEYSYEFTDSNMTYSVDLVTDREIRERNNRRRINEELQEGIQVPALVGMRWQPDQEQLRRTLRFIFYTGLIIHGKHLGR